MNHFVAIPFVDHEKVSFWAVICDLVEVLNQYERLAFRDALRVEPNFPISFDVSDQGGRHRSRITYEIYFL